MQTKTKRIALATLSMAIVLGAGFFSASNAFAAPVVSLTGNATLKDGGGRAIGAVWGDQPPYKVNFSCGVPGCSNYVTPSTTTTDVLRYVEYDVCNSGFYATHQIYVWMQKGAGTEVSATSHTTWTSSPAC
jgi:hypothetical protein